VLSAPAFKKALYFSTYRGTRAYVALTVISTAKAILSAEPHGTQATVYVDGLPKSRLRWFGTELCRLSIRTDKGSGVRQQTRSSARPMPVAASCGEHYRVTSPRLNFSYNIN
jgi:hypothetical protein